MVLCTEANPHGHKVQESCKQNCHLDHVTCSSSCRKQHTFNKFGFMDCSKNCKFTYSNCSDGCLPKGFSATPIVEAEPTTQSSVLTQHGGQTASSSTSVCLKACSAVSDACKVECKNDPSCLQECSNDYDGCVNDCGQNALKDRNGIASVANSTNSEKVSCMMGCSVENVDCMTECQTDISDSSCLTECTAELGECQKECHDRNPEIPAGQSPSVADPAKELTGASATGWIDPSNTVQQLPYSIHSTCTRQCSLERSKCEIECTSTDVSCKPECRVEYDECITECNQDYGQNAQTGLSIAADNSGKSDIGFSTSPKTTLGISSSSSSTSKSGAVVLDASAHSNPNTEIVIKTSEGNVNTSSSEPMGILKLLCLSSCGIERRSCLEECKMGTPEVGCTTECYDEYKECVVDCKGEEIERQIETLETEKKKLEEKLEKEKEKLEEKLEREENLKKNLEMASNSYKTFSLKDIAKDQGENYDYYDSESSSESNES